MLLSDSRLFYHWHLSSVYSMFFNCKCGGKKKTNPKHVCLPPLETRTVPSDWICLGLFWSTVAIWALILLFSRQCFFSLHQCSQFISRQSFSTIPPLLPLKNMNYFIFFLCTRVSTISIWLQILFLHVIVGWPWASCWISLGLNLFILKMGMITVLTSQFCSKD